MSDCCYLYMGLLSSVSLSIADPITTLTKAPSTAFSKKGSLIQDSSFMRVSCTRGEMPRGEMPTVSEGLEEGNWEIKGKQRGEKRTRRESHEGGCYRNLLVVRQVCLRTAIVLLPLPPVPLVPVPLPLAPPRS